MHEAASNHYNWLCRVIDNGYEISFQEQADAQELLKEVVANNPLYLLSEEKAQASKDYIHDELSGQIGDYMSMIHPCVVADPEGVVMIYGVERTDIGWQVYGMSIAYDEITSQFGIPIVAMMIGKLTVVEAGTDIVNYRVGDQHTVGSILLPEKNKIRGVLSDTSRDEDFKEAAQQDFRSALLTAMEQLWYTQKPRVTVVKYGTAPEPRKHKKRPQKTPRADQREVHIILDPDEVREIRKQQGGTHASPVPHKRKAHRRVLRHPRYGDNVGKVIQIGEMDVNCAPGEVIRTPRRIYHVVSVGGNTKKE